ncbi:MAG TPA: PEP-CTERM sorting domain-containing protein [Chthoniobacterales bacterium]|jgi:hypothetical protein|nr:PEP-CTERM sorting domain-containing protein [Chthoniobacterales bacterium]
MKGTSPSLQIFKPTMAATLAIAIMCGLSVRPAQAGYIVTLQQVGSDVVATGSGPIDLTGLSFKINFSFAASIEPNNALILTGSSGFSGTDEYSGSFSGPLVFGTGGGTLASSASGDFVGFHDHGFLDVPTGYISGTALSDSATYNNATFSSLGVNIGTYEWTWGNGQNQNFTLVAVPEGSTLGLLAVGALALGLVWMRRKVKA